MSILQGLEGCQLGDQWIPSGARWGHHYEFLATFYRLSGLASP